MKKLYWKQHCKSYCPHAEHCLEEHIPDNTITLSIIKECFITQKRVGIDMTFKEFMDNTKPIDDEEELWM